MKVCVTADSQDFNPQVDPRFGRCKYFFLIDTDNNSSEIIENTGKESSSGAGIAAAGLLVEKGAEAVITGNCGPKAFQVLTKSGIKVITGVSGGVWEALENFSAGRLSETKEANVSAHFGMKR
jgi:predicted Fe-Mo cluster-binding NifX family protein